VSLRAALPVSGWLGVVACTPGAKSTGAIGPFLSVVVHDAGAAPMTGVAPASIALALGSLPDEEVARLAEVLRDSADVALRRKAPDVFALDEEAPGEAEGASLDPSRAVLMDVPALTAAANVLGSPWSAPGIVVSLGATCAAGASRCVPLFTRETEGKAAGPEEAVIRRARGLAWALGNAGLIQATATTRAPLLRALQAARARRDSTIALAFGAPRGTLDARSLDVLHRQALAALDLLSPGAPQRRWLAMLAEAPASWTLPIDLGEGAILVVPRLGAMAHLQDFVAEVEGAGAVTWLARPAVRARPLAGD
jgi:hypothetical protein